MDNIRFAFYITIGIIIGAFILRYLESITTGEQLIVIMLALILQKMKW